MQTLIKNKGTLAAVALFIVIMFVYNLFFKQDEIQVASDLTASSVGNNLLKIRSELQRVTLKQDLFSAPGYLLLTDFSMQIPLQASGRRNPFDIIGRD